MAAQPVLQDKAKLFRVMTQVAQVPVLPHVVYKVLEISSSTDTPALAIERAIVVDPGFSSKVLSLANSAFYGLPRKVTSIHEAVLFLGFKALRQLAMTVGVFDLFVGKNDRESLRRRAWWRHSVDTAVCCRWLARDSRKLPEDDAYTAGLLHYIGKTLLDRFGDGDYERVDVLIANGIPDVKAEIAVFGCDHISVAMSAGRTWGFPEALIAGMNYVTPAQPDDEFRQRRAAVALGQRIAQVAVGEAKGPYESLLPYWALETLGYTQEHAEPLILKGTSEIAAAAKLQL
ncbi:MAG TPA: HDOD domain-containing protein [Fimbriimonadaceae bacterium]|nr:HDOD domain-containing protein [Fimbriimonadaceae bacterium]